MMKGSVQERSKMIGIEKEIPILVRSSIRERKNIIAATPKEYRREIIEILKNTRKVKTFCGDSVDWGWFRVINTAYRTYAVISSNKRLPYVVPDNKIERLNEFCFRFVVPENMVLLRTKSGNVFARYEIVGIFTDDGWLLEVERKKALMYLDRLEKKLLLANG